VIPSRMILNPATLKPPSPRAIAERHLSKSFKTLSANPLNFQGAIASYKGPRDGFQDFELQARIPKIMHRDPRPGFPENVVMPGFPGKGFRVKSLGFR
jgi:hypothetical protein